MLCDHMGISVVKRRHDGLKLFVILSFVPNGIQTTAMYVEIFLSTSLNWSLKLGNRVKLPVGSWVRWGENIHSPAFIKDFFFCCSLGKTPCCVFD